MNYRVVLSTVGVAVLLALAASEAFTQDPGFGGRGRGGPGAPGRFGGGGGGPMNRPERELLEEFDANNDGWLNKQERSTARESLKDRDDERGGPGFGPPGRGRRGPGRRGDREPAKPGVSVSPAEVANYPEAPLYDPAVLRTIFIEFENSDWEAELEAFHNSDVEVPAKVTVDGQEYPDVGVHFRGKSSYGMVPRGFKRSLNLALDFVHDEQRLYGYKTLNLLNCNGDPSFLSTVLYSHIARQYIPTPKANLVKVVINGENWGVYANVQQFNKEFLKENFKPSGGTRWKVNGSPRGDGGLRYMGDDITEYESRYEMKSGDGELAWKALIDLCRTLDETPTDQLEAALEPMLDIDGVLKFLALDVALVNSDGYWTRASDYSIFLDEDGKFHVIPHDMNEAFRTGGGRGFGPPGAGPPRGEDRRNRRPDAEGPPRDARLAGDPPMRGDRPAARGPRDRGPAGFGPEEFGRRGPEGRGRGGPGGRGPGGRGPGGPGHGGVDLDPLVGLDEARMPLRSRLLAAPKLRAKYLDYVRSIAETSLDWQNLGPVIEEYRDLVSDDVEADTRKLDSFTAFEQATDPTASSAQSLRSFADGRREFLLKYLDSQQK